MKGDSVFKQKENIVTRTIAGETLLVPISGELANMERIFTLNEVGASIWGFLDGNTSLEEVLGKIVHAYDVEKSEAWEDMELLVANLARDGLVEEITGK